MTKNIHSHGRNSGSFEKHVANSVRNTGEGLGKKKMWISHAAFRIDRYPLAPHFRHISRTPSLPGKHMRTVVEAVRSTHGKS